MAAIKQTLPSYELTQARFRKQADGKPRHNIVRDCLVERDERLVAERQPWNLEQELEPHCWKRGRDRRPSKEEWEKKNDDGIDMMRYAVMYLDAGPSGDDRPIVPKSNGRLYHRRPTRQTGVSI